MDCKARKCVFLGYGTNVKGYRLFDPERSRVVHSRDVIFNERERGRADFDESVHKPDRCVELLIPDEEEMTDTADAVPNPGPAEIPVSAAVPKCEPVPDIPAEAEQVLEPKDDSRRPVRNPKPVVRLTSDRLGEWTSVSEVREPLSVKQALESTEWRSAMQKEMDSLRSNDVWELVPLPEGRKAIGSKWVFKVKQKPDGSVERYKARLVAQGFAQRYGLDYDQTFSPVVRFESFRTILAISTKEELTIHQMDVNTAFLNGELEEEVYLKQPEAFEEEGKSHLVCKLKRSLYGLKQSPRCWNWTLHSFLVDLGFVQIASDPCVYLSSEGEVSRCVLAVYVDDMIIAAKTLCQVNYVKRSLKRRFAVQDMGELHHFLGIQVVKNNGNIWIGQPLFIERTISKYRMEDANPSATPMDVNSKLVKSSEEDELCDKMLYQSAVGSLMYLSVATRPDITYPVNTVAKFSAEPNQKHWTAVKRILRYLKGTPQLGLLYRQDGSGEIRGYSDADWAGDLDDRKSTSGYIFTLAGAAISWRSKKQTCVALSTAEAEYVALAIAAQEVVWLRQLIQECEHRELGPTEIFEDNQAAISMSKNPTSHGRSKHVDIRYHYIRTQVEKGIVSLKYCPTEKNTADILTKALVSEKFGFHRKASGVEGKPSAR